MVDSVYLVTGRFSRPRYCLTVIGFSNATNTHKLLSEMCFIYGNSGNHVNFRQIAYSSSLNMIGKQSATTGAWVSL